MPGYITIDLVRDELQDRFPGDNTIDCDQFFSDDEILHAMDRAAARYNQLRPIGVEVVHGRALPANSSIFLDAVLSALYGAAIHKLSRNLMTWRTGDVSVDLEKTRLEAFRALKTDLDRTWREDALERKAEINRTLAWGYY